MKSTTVSLLRKKEDIMATKTFEELKQLAIQIRDEKTNKQNTATRIGTQMLEHLNKLEQDYYDKTATDEELKQRDEKLTELSSKAERTNWSIGDITYEDKDGYLTSAGVYQGIDSYHSKTTSRIKVATGDSFRYKGIGRSAGVSWIFFNGEAIASTGQYNNTEEYTEVVVPDGVDNVMFSSFARKDETVILDVVLINSFDDRINLKIDSVSKSVTDISEKAESIKSDVDVMSADVASSKSITDLFDFQEKISDKNLLNPDLYEPGYLNSSGELLVTASSTLSVSGYIPVKPGTTYSIYAFEIGGSIGRTRFINYFEEGKQHISGSQDSLKSVITTPQNCSFLRISTYSKTSDGIEFDLTNTGVFEGENAEFEKYNLGESLNYAHSSSTTDLDDESIVNKKDVYNLIKSETTNQSGDLDVTVEWPNVRIANGADNINVTLNRYFGVENNYSGNPMLNFTRWEYGGISYNNVDDVAPMHVQNTTIGANHAQPCVIGTITAHGKDNKSIGTEWTAVDGTKYYIMRIVDENNIVFLSENKGTAENHEFIALSEGKLTSGSESLTVTAVKSAQLFESVFNVTQKILKNGIENIESSQNFKADYIDIVEEYDIVNTHEVLESIKLRKGSSENPVFTNSTAMIHVQNMYRILSNLTVLVYANIIFRQSVKFKDIMINQAMPISTANDISYYIPNSLPIKGYDFRKPLKISFSTDVPYLGVDKSVWADPDVAPNRIVQFYGEIGFAIGYIPGINLSTDETFEMRYNTGKIYPHVVRSSVAGDMREKDDVFNGGIYRCFFKKPENERLSFYHFTHNSSEYVYIDYKSSCLDNVILDESFNGKKIEVIESQNTNLKTDIYNNGFFVKATYIEDDTCYIVVKIS